MQTTSTRLGVEAASPSITPSKPGGDGQRLLAVQALRAVAVILVLFAHCIDGAEDALGTPRQAHFFFWENFGSAGLDIFFVISGFIVSLVAARAANPRANAAQGQRGSKTGLFLIRRITRIFPLYWLLTAIFFFERIQHNPVTWRALFSLQTLLLLPSMGFPQKAPLLSIGWSLLFELYFYLVLSTFLFLTPRAVVRNTTLFLGAMVVLGALIGIRHPLLVVWMNPMVLEFVLGCLIGLLYVRLRNSGARVSSIAKWFALFGAVLLAATVFTGYGSASESSTILAGDDCWLRLGVWGFPSALLVGGVIFWAPAMRSLLARLLVFLGDASYSIYLCGIPAQVIINYCWRRIWKPGPDVGVFFGVVVCAAVGVACYMLIERPLMRFFHNWYKPNPFGESAQAGGRGSSVGS